MFLINRKIIAKNTLLLYLRMLLTMVINLFTVRVVLNTLGVEDYGIYNVVGGIVVMFSFINRAMASTAQRYFAFEIGKGNNENLQKLFNLNLMIFIGIAIVILILSETIGLWFFKNEMNIPPDRMEAANWVYQFSVLSFLLSVIIIPYNAIIIAMEKMNIYAYINILEAILKLIIVYLLVIFSFDKLKLYGLLVFIIYFITSFIYVIYSSRNFKECSFKFYWNASTFKELISYSGWNLYEIIANVFKAQGINILLNIFFGAIVNAARGIAYQVSGGINQFVLSFYIAVHPQITKSYASCEHKGMFKLTFQTSKFCYYLIFILSLPILIEMPIILKLWIKTIPDYAIIFTRLVILNAIIDTLGYPLITLAQATGKIKKYQLVIGTTTLLIFPISYIALKSGLQPQSTMYISIIISIVCVALRIHMLKGLVNLSLPDYFRNVIIPIVLVTIPSCIISLLPYYFFDETILRLIIASLFSIFATGIIILFVGMTKVERNFIINNIKAKIFKHEK
jgi:O-antigen/teichoic acid export membrane protein